MIVGKPNVGKSSLLNNLLERERAIVTDVAGTTRDSIEETFMLGDVKINLTDTAGIHETSDIVEKIGVDKAKNLIEQADIVLFLIDSSRKFTSEDQMIYDSIKNKKHIVVKTKSDLNKADSVNFDGEIEISAVTNSGIDTLKNKILELTEISSLSNSSVVITNERHREALEYANNHIQNAIQNISDDTLDLVSIDIKSAYIEIGKITGNTTSEDIIDAIFSKFCLGK